MERPDRIGDYHWFRRVLTSDDVESSVAAMEGELAPELRFLTGA